MKQEQTLPVGQIQPNPWNRKSFDAQALQELSQSIKSKGMLEPIIVRKVAEDKYEIASGERRWRAAQLAGQKVVPIRLRELTDADVQDMNLYSNVQREDVSALEKATMIKARMASGRLTQIQIANFLGKSDTWIGNQLAVLNLTPGVQEKLANYSLGDRPMQAIAALPNDAYKDQIAQELQDGKIKPEHVEHRAHQLHNGFKASMAKRNKREAKADQTVTTDAAKTADIAATTETVGPANVRRNGSSAVSLASTASVASSTAPISVAKMATAFKDDLANQYLGQFGAVGGVLRTGLDKIWGGPKKKMILWALVLTVVGWAWGPVHRTLNYVFRRVMHLEVNSMVNRNTVPVFGNSPRVAQNTSAPAVSENTGVPIPVISNLTYVAGHKIRLDWTDLGPGYAYKVYIGWSDEMRGANEIVTGKTVSTPGAVVDFPRAAAVNTDPYFAVMAVSPVTDGELSAPMQGHLTISNQNNSVESLPRQHAASTAAPMQQSARPSRAIQNRPAVVLSPPAELKGQRLADQKVHFTWQPVPGAVGYNLYSTFENQPVRRETDQPTRDTEGTWFPDFGPGQYKVIVTAVDAQGHESGYSNELSFPMR